MNWNDFRKRQISQWEFAPEGAFKVYRDVRSTICEFTFYRRADNSLVKDDFDSEELKFLKENEVAIHA